jgi:hypothetical protein
LLACAFGCEQRAAPAASVDPIVPVIRETTVESMCEDDSYERSCFDVTREECRQWVSRLYDACAVEHATELSPGRKAGKIGALLGGCTSQRYIGQLRALGKVDSEGRCADPTSFF